MNEVPKSRKILCLLNGSAFFQKIGIDFQKYLLYSILNKIITHSVLKYKYYLVYQAKTIY